MPRSHRSLRHWPAPLGALVLLTACGDAPGVSRDALDLDAPPPLAEQMADGTCRARDTVPAVYEHVMGEVQVVQAEIAEDGTVVRPPIYRKAPVPRVVRERGEVTFEAPCPDQMTPEFIASVQRALAARGHFAGNVTGALDAPTAAAIRRYQSERGLESAQLSLETARALGLIAVDLSKDTNG
ncbi:peptidoglycan-binding domain-containing protein [Maliponia aquimaris]|uniref:Putative peptidoglycan binding domain protein n=1 Tax=Maliponia aquimaris TaxID=1673631 RepID=A0A238KLM5_9RHOB|nr:peptidoglycan-binding domain-containing protein [Maliponia aquimaris]SMX43600.1 Putative peptidoglycan binding domain protein [Maliponia aquimaris]